MTARTQSISGYLPGRRAASPRLPAAMRRSNGTLGLRMNFGLLPGGSTRRAPVSVRLYGPRVQTASGPRCAKRPLAGKQLSKSGAGRALDGRRLRCTLSSRLKEAL
ncbi:unnamed protein product [Lota lota]